jgi:hypothetical protein
MRPLTARSAALFAGAMLAASAFAVSVFAVSVFAVSAFAGPAAAASAPAPGPASGFEVSFDKNRVAGAVGDQFTIESRITNRGAVPTGAHVAHLDVTSLTDAAYVDPEDWSPDRSMDVGRLEPGESTTLTWDVHAVDDGSFDLYVVLLPAGAEAGKGPLAVSPPVYLEIASRRLLSVGGALPVAVSVPIMLGMVTGGVLLRLRRTR